jgi:hypothetical protein
MRKLLFTAVIAAAGSYGLYQQGILDTGSFSAEVQNWLNTTDNAGRDPDAEETTVYKVQNPDGTWTYTNQKPANRAPAQTRVYRSDTNVVPAVPAAKPATKNKTAGRTESLDETLQSKPLDPRLLKAPMESAKEVEDVLRKRHERQQRIIDGE